MSRFVRKQKCCEVLTYDMSGGVQGRFSTKKRIIRRRIDSVRPGVDIGALLTPEEMFSSPGIGVHLVGACTTGPCRGWHRKAVVIITRRASSLRDGGKQSH